MKKRTLWTNKFDYIDEYAEMLKADYPDYFEDMNDEDKINERAYELACDFNNDTLDEIPDKIIYKLYGGIDFCHDDFGNDESTDNNIVNEIMESVYGETIKK